MAKPASQPRVINNSLDELSQRVSAALDEDAQRRRWTTRIFFILALVPVLIALFVFLAGKNDIELTEKIAEEKAQRAVSDASHAVIAQVTQNVSTSVTQQVSDTISKDVTAQVTQQVNASVASELKDVRDVSALLPSLRSAAEALPKVVENQRVLSEYRTQIDRTIERQQALSQSVAAATDSLSAIPKQLSGLQSQLQQVNERSDSEQSRIASTLKDVNATTAALQDRIKDTELKVATVAQAAQSGGTSIASVRAELQKTRASLMRDVEAQIKAMPDSESPRLQSMEKRIAALANQSRRLKKVEASIARMPKTATDTRKLERSIGVLSKQISSIDRRLKALEKSNNPSSNKLSRDIRSLQGSISKMNSSINSTLSKMAKRLTALERAQTRNQTRIK